MENNLMEYRTHQWGLPDKRELLWLETAMICASCLHRWIAGRPVGSDFNRLECPGCGVFKSEQAYEYNACRVLH